MRRIDKPAVFFQLRFAGAAQADAAGIARQVGPHFPQPRQRVFQLGQLDLQAGLHRARPRGKDVEDQLAAVEHFDLGGLFKIANLGWRQVVIKNDYIGLCGFDERPCSSSTLPLPI